MEKRIRRAMELLSSGLPRKEVVRRLGGEGAEEVVEVALCRLRARDKYSISDRLYFDEVGLRYSTPEIVADYRASVISGYELITDVSAGVGIQAIFFGFTNKYVQGFDIDPRRVFYARRNARAYGVKNVRFDRADALSPETVERARASDVIYSDPARPPTEEERGLDTLSPPPLKVMELYSRYVDRFVFDLPPQIRHEKLPSAWSLEYISIDGRISRLTAYVGFSLPPRVAVSLPSGARLEGEGSGDFEIHEEVGDYLYVVDEAVYYASLLPALQSRHPGLRYLSAGRRRTLATSSGPIRSPFLQAYRVEEVTEFDVESIRRALRRAGVGRAVVRFRVDPGDYWAVRGQLERGLEGDAEAHIFRLEERAIVAIPLQNVV